MSHLAAHLLVDVMLFASGVVIGGVFVSRHMQRVLDRARQLLTPPARRELDAAVEVAKSWRSSWE